MKLHIDFETRSPINLLTDGAPKYAEQADIICMAYAFDDGPIQLWQPILNPNDPFPTAVTEHFINRGICYACNAEFEMAIIESCLPDIAPERWQWTCTANMARACALPGKLANLCRALGTQAQKQESGLDLIKQLCVPREGTTYNEDPELLKQMGDYCVEDVRTERECASCLRELSAREHDDYLATVEVNARGVPVDLELAGLAQQYAEAEKDDLMHQLELASGGDLTKTAGVKLTAWAYERLAEEHRSLMERVVDGVTKLTLDKRTRFELLALPDLDPDLRTVIECCDMASRSSVSKFKNMQSRAQSDGRVRGAYLSNGAGQTGRYSSIGLQVHNLPRASMPAPEETIADMRDGLPICSEGQDTMTVLSHLLRQAICAPEGKWFVWSDLSAIEGRVLPWLAQDIVADNKLHLFAKGEDIYVHTAAEMFNLNLDDVNDTLRQQGKIAELSLGFGGGAGALKAMARNYGVVFEDDEAESIKDKWRDANSWAQRFWQDAECAALRAIKEPESYQEAGRLQYLYTPGALHDALWCILPSGRPLCYPSVRIEWNDTPWGDQQEVITGLKASLLPKQGETEWPRQRIWKGLLAENATQAVAADILRGALRELVLVENAPVVAHTHDEIVLECADSISEIDFWRQKLEAALTRVPEWAEGLPLACKSDDGYRYSK